MELLSVLRRRWILTSILLLLTLAGSAAAYLKLPSTYQATSSIVFLVPKNVAKTFHGNPFLAFNSTLNETADVARYETTDMRTANLLAARGYTAFYTVTDAIDTSGPVLLVTVTDHNKAMVEHTLSGVTSEVSTKLRALQSGLAPGNQIRDVVITFTPKPTLLVSKKLRPLSVVVGFGLILTVGIPMFIDAMVVRRRLVRDAPPQERSGARRSDGPPAGPGTAREPRRAAKAPDDASYTPRLARSPSGRVSPGRPSPDRQSADQPSAERPAGERPSADRTSPDQPSMDRPSAERPSAERQSADRP